MKREQIADIAARYYPLPVKSGRDIIKMDNWCDEFADEVMALPLDVPSDEEIEKFYENAIYDNSNGATWMRDEIIKRNVK